MEEENEEIVDHSLVEGEGNSFTLGGIEAGLPKNPMKDVSDGECESDDDQSGSEQSTRAPKGGRKHVRASEVEEEKALEACNYQLLCFVGFETFLP